jgi:calcium-translocating P-type ATPase
MNSKPDQNLERPPFAPHYLSLDEVKASLSSPDSGLTEKEAESRLESYGTNEIPTQKAVGLSTVFFRQFLSPLIYILCFAAALSFALGHMADAGFIAAVLLINAMIGTFQEYSAEKSAQALRALSSQKALVRRGGEIQELAAKALVPGDRVILESGMKIPADLRLTEARELQIDESLLTGESQAIEKNAAPDPLEKQLVLGDRLNSAFTGTWVVRGRAEGIVTQTGLSTELGKIATAISGEKIAKTPLVERTEKLSKTIMLILSILIVILSLILLYQGTPWIEVILTCIALAVGAIPEGLPIAITVALAIAMSRMAKRNVIVRKLPALEALGSCTFIATDKTGTLTKNELSVEKIWLASNRWVDIHTTGEHEAHFSEDSSELDRICLAGALCNEGELTHRDGSWKARGDSVDIALLSVAQKRGILADLPKLAGDEVASLPFESDNQFSAALYESEKSYILSAKGSLEKILELTKQSDQEKASIEKAHESLASQAYRVIAIAFKEAPRNQKPKLRDHRLRINDIRDLTFLGLFGIIDPLRPETAEAIKKCKNAGIEVAMITGDHPLTAQNIGKKLQINNSEKVITGKDLREQHTDPSFQEKLSQTRIFARIEPQQKLSLVEHFMSLGHYVAVTGDGANDAPALKRAHVGVSMGKAGTDVARETSDLIITDDHFDSVVNGIEEGRIAYQNVRKIIYLLLSTGGGEIVLFTLSIMAGLPAPLTAVQLLWLNLVTNGIQDVALAFEPGEGSELEKKPRPPGESLFERVMSHRVGLSALVVGAVSFAYYWALLESGLSSVMAQNSVLLLMVLFENIMVGNARSESKSAFSLSPLRNPILLTGTLGAQLLHIGVMHWEPLGSILGTKPVSFSDWAFCLLLALSVLIADELYKVFKRRRDRFEIDGPLK